MLYPLQEIQTLPNNLRQTIFDNVSNSEDETHVIGTRNGYIKMDLNKYQLKEEPFFINRVEVSSINSDPEPIEISRKINKKLNLIVYQNKEHQDI